MEIKLSKEAQQALENIVRILDASHKLLHDIKKELVSQNEMTHEMLDEFAKLKGNSENDR